jgi:hypothetical protein
MSSDTSQSCVESRKVRQFQLEGDTRTLSSPWAFTTAVKKIIEAIRYSVPLQSRIDSYQKRNSETPECSERDLYAVLEIIQRSSLDQR